MRILAVDDDPTALAILEATLRCEGHGDLATASGGAAALALLAAGDVFHCFLLDVQMPGMDGVELCGRIRRMAACRAAPIIMISAMTDRAVIAQALEAGATDYVGKPFDPLELAARLGVAERLVAQQASERASLARVDFLRARLGSDARIQFEDAFALAGLPSFVSPFELENHLLRLPRLRAWRSSAYTIHLVEAESLFASLSGEDFLDLIRATGRAIMAALGPRPHVASYTGWGAFTVVVEGSSRPKADALQDAVREAMRARGFAVDEGPLTCAVEVEGGASVHGHLGSPTGLSHLSRITQRRAQ